MIWNKFLSNIKQNPEDLGLSLGKKNHPLISDMFFAEYATNYHDFGESYMVITSDKTASAKIKQPNSVVGVTQLVAYLDVGFNTEEATEGFSPKLIQKVISDGQEFEELNIKLISAIKKTETVEIFFRSESYSLFALQVHQICFFEENEDTFALVGRPYLEKAHILKNSIIKESLH